MKVGVVTVHNGQNYGASLQAYALVTKLRNSGIEAFLIDYRNAKIEDRIASKTKEKNDSISGILKNLRSFSSDMLFNTSQHLCYVRDKFSLFHDMILDSDAGIFHTCAEMKKLNQYYDAFICGSDQIWNYNITGLDDAFFLLFADESKKRISYAPSLGMSSDSIGLKLKAEIGEKLQHIEYLSIREENNKSLIEELTQRCCQTVVDPVLLFTADEWLDLLEIADDVCPSQPYAFYYPVIEQPELESFAMKEAKRRGWKLLNPRLVPKYAKAKGYTEVPRAIVGPAEFLKLLAGSKAVFTNSFHATVFSSVFQNELYVMPMKGKHSVRNNRIYEYLKKIEVLSDQAIDGRMIYIESNRFKNCDPILKTNRELSIEYLLNSLK